MNKESNLDLMWQRPPAIFRPAPFWSWNGKLDPERLCKQIESMHEQGMGGFFMHSRYGLKTEYLGEEWFECVRVCVEKARQLGEKGKERVEKELNWRHFTERLMEALEARS